MADTLNQNQIDSLDLALTGAVTTDQSSAPVVTKTEKNAKAPNKADNPVKGSPSNTPLLSSGNATKSESAIKQSNETVSKACDSSSYVGKAVAEIGVFAGDLMRKLREAVKAALEALGFNPGSNAIVNQIKKIAQWIKDQTKWINDISKYVVKMITYLNAIKQLLQYLLSMPARLLVYFAECISLLKKQLVASYQTALNNTEIPSTDTTEITNAINEVKTNVDTLTQSVKTLEANAQNLIQSGQTLNQINSGNTQMQAESTKEVFTLAGFQDTSNNFGKA